MHSQLETPAGYTLMAADTPNGMEYTPGSNHSVSLSGDNADEAELRGYFEKLVRRRHRHHAARAAPWGDSFGMVVDKFGVQWLVNIAGAGQGVDAGSTARQPIECSRSAAMVTTSRTWSRPPYHG